LSDQLKEARQINFSGTKIALKIGAGLQLSADFMSDSETKVGERRIRLISPLFCRYPKNINWQIDYLQSSERIERGVYEEQ